MSSGVLAPIDHVVLVCLAVEDGFVGLEDDKLHDPDAAARIVRFGHPADGDRTRGLVGRRWCGLDRLVLCFDVCFGTRARCAIHDCGGAG